MVHQKVDLLIQFERLPSKKLLGHKGEREILMMQIHLLLGYPHFELPTAACCGTLGLGGADGTVGC